MVTTFFKGKKIIKFLNFIYNNLFFSKLKWSYDHPGINVELPLDLATMGLPKTHEKHGAELVLTVQQNSAWWNRLTLKQLNLGFLRTKVHVNSLLQGT